MTPRWRPLEDGVRGAQNAVDDVEVGALELGDHLVYQVRPLVGEVLPTNDADRVTQLRGGNDDDDKNLTAIDLFVVSKCISINETSE